MDPWSSVIWWVARESKARATVGHQDALQRLGVGTRSRGMEALHVQVGPQRGNPVLGCTLDQRQHRTRSGTPTCACSPQLGSLLSSRAPACALGPPWAGGSGSGRRGLCLSVVRTCPKVCPALWRWVADCLTPQPSCAAGGWTGCTTAWHGPKSPVGKGSSS